MHKSSFYVSLCTTDPVSQEEYQLQADKMVSVFTDVFTDKSKIAKLTKSSPLESIHTELDVSAREGGGLQGRAVVEMSGPKRVGLDKPKLSQMFKESAPWKNCKIEKKAVDLEPFVNAVGLGATPVAELL